MHTDISELTSFTFVERTVRIKSVGKRTKNEDNAFSDIAIFLKIRFSSF